MLLLLNLFGIVTVAVLVFLLMNLSEKEEIAKSTARREDEKIENENKVIAEVAEKIVIDREQRTTIIRENIKAE